MAEPLDPEEMAEHKERIAHHLFLVSTASEMGYPYRLGKFRWGQMSRVTQDRAREVANKLYDRVFSTVFGDLVAERDRLAAELAEAREQIVRALAGEGTAATDCRCEPCLGRGIDGHGHSHCAECCFGTFVLGEPGCPIHGEGAADQPEGRDT